MYPRLPHIMCILSSTVSPPALNSSAGTSSGPGFTTSYSVIFPLSLYKSSQYPFHLSVICVASVKFSPVADWIHWRRGWYFEIAAWNFLLSSLLPIPHTCLPAAAIYSLEAFSVPLPSVLDIGLSTNGVSLCSLPAAHHHCTLACTHFPSHRG